MSIVEYSSTITLLPLKSTTITVSYAETYPGPNGSPMVKVWSTKYNTTEDYSGRWTKHKSRDSEATVGYAKYVAKGWPLPFHNFTYNERHDRDWEGYKIDSSVPNAYGTSNVLFQQGSWNFPNNPRLAEGRIASGCQGLMSAVDKQRVHDRALASAISRIRNQKIDVGVALGEHKQTMRLVADNAIKIAGALASLKRGDFAGAANRFGTGLPTRARRRFDRDFVNRDRPKAISRAWLELQYGWKPLLTDIYGACEQLAEQPRPVYQQCSGQAAYSNTITGTYDKTPTSVFVEDGNHTYLVKYVIRFSTPNAAAQDLGRLGLLNPATVAWELMPWSFVIDWFLPIGNWLGSFNYEMGLAFIDGSMTTFEKIDSKATVTSFGTQNERSYSGSRVKVSKSVSVGRTKLFGFPSVPYPTFKNPVSRGHMLNAMALLTLLRK